MGKDKDTKYRGEYMQAVDPVDGSLFDVLIPANKLEWVCKQGKGAILELHHSVRHVLSQPRQIFQGLCRDEDDTVDGTENWLCYSGVPNVRYVKESGEIRPTKNRVLLVFVNAERTVYTYRWSEENPSMPGYPTDYDERFKRKLL